MEQFSPGLIRAHGERLRLEASHGRLESEHGTVPVWRRSVGRGLIGLGTRLSGCHRPTA